MVLGSSPRSQGGIWSQFDEDVILLYLASKLNPPHSFVEIGCGDGSENNTRALAERGWTGLWIEADPGRAIQADLIGEPLGVRVVCERMQRESTFAFPRVFGVLSIDVDGNDYHLWRALCSGPCAWDPYIVVIEAQIQQPYDAPFVMPYNSEWVWPDNPETETYRWGASVFSLIELGKELGYAYYGKPANPHSPNLIFIRNDLQIH